MRGFFITKNKNLSFCFLSRLLTFVLAFSLVFSPVASYAQSINLLNLPVPGTMVGLSPIFNPAIVTGIKIYPDNPLQFDFIIDIGDDQLQGEALKAESQKLINYFMATLTVPEDEMWVNLSPYEKDRIIAEGLSHTEMGRDMLAQDYMLKQLTASLMYPEEDFGKEFWNRVYSKAQAEYGTTEIPMNTFNKIWIVPDEAIVYVNDTNVFIVENHLKVMLEEDYLALESNVGSTKHGLGDVTKDDIEIISGVSAEIIREVLLPEIEKEVNEGKNFANLRQMYNSMLLATWYKKNLKESLLGKIYADKNKVNGIELDDKEMKQKIYDRYVEAFEKGVYNYIKEDIDSVTQEVIPRKYFSGGISNYFENGLKETKNVSSPIAAKLEEGSYAIARVNGKMLGDETVSSPIRGEASSDILSEDSVRQWLIEQTQGDSRVVVEVNLAVLRKFGLGYSNYEKLEYDMLWKIFGMRQTQGPNPMSMYFKGFSDEEVISMRDLMDVNNPQPANIVALAELLEAIRDGRTTIEEGRSRQILRKKGIVDEDGNIPEFVQIKAPLIVEGEEIEMRLSPPLSQLIEEKSSLPIAYEAITSEEVDAVTESLREKVRSITSSFSGEREGIVEENDVTISLAPDTYAQGGGLYVYVSAKGMRGSLVTIKTDLQGDLREVLQKGGRAITAFFLEGALHPLLQEVRNVMSKPELVGKVNFKLAYEQRQKEVSEAKELIRATAIAGRWADSKIEAEIEKIDAREQRQRDVDGFFFRLKDILRNKNTAVSRMINAYMEYVGMSEYTRDNILGYYERQHSLIYSLRRVILFPTSKLY